MLLCTLILEESFNLEELGKWARVCPGLVGPSVVRDFRGAMIGRADRGLIIYHWDL